MSALPCSSQNDKSMDGRDCVVVVATYNEIDNLPRLVAAIKENLPAAQILIIDDGSPDGTGRWCDEYQSEHSSFEVIHRSGKLGLGSATLTGFRWALEHGCERVLTMDADFSHCPNEIGRLLHKKLQMCSDQQGPGIVIGSRYVPGGKIEGWPWTRRIASRWINRFARFWLRLPSKDNSGAFRCYDASALQAIQLERITNQGYGYLEEILFLARRNGVQVVEVPITFRDRIEGQSKINFGEACSAIWTLLGLGFRLRISNR